MKTDGVFAGKLASLREHQNANARQISEVGLQNAGITGLGVLRKLARRVHALRKGFTDALQFMSGEGFLSPGGPEDVAEMLAYDSLAGKRILDIGSKLGDVDALTLSEGIDL